MISVIHPSRTRPQKSFEAFQKWKNRAQSNDFEWIVSLDKDDPTMTTYEALYAGAGVTIIKGANKSAIDAINRAAKKSTGDILMVVSDDTDCPNGWVSMINHARPGNSDWIMKLEDGIQQWIITMPVMDRVYYNRFGYIYNPGYKHMFCDTELTCVADILNKKVIRRGIMFRHQHYSVTHETRDALNERNDGTWQQGEKLFIERAKRNFDLKERGYIQDKNMVYWFEQHGIKMI